MDSFLLFPEQKSLQRQNNTYGGTTTVHNRKQISGTASSVAFTPLQVNIG